MPSWSEIVSSPSTKPKEPTQIIYSTKSIKRKKETQVIVEPTSIAVEHTLVTVDPTKEA